MGVSACRRGRVALPRNRRGITPSWQGHAGAWTRVWGKVTPVMRGRDPIWAIGHATPVARERRPYHADTPTTPILSALKCNRCGQAGIRDPKRIDQLHCLMPDFLAKLINQAGDSL